MTDDDIDQQRSAALAGLRVLVVEDEYYIADDIRRTLAAAGATVVGPIGHLSAAEAAVAKRRVRLRDRRSQPA